VARTVKKHLNPTRHSLGKIRPILTKFAIFKKKFEYFLVFLMNNEENSKNFDEKFTLPSPCTPTPTPPFPYTPPLHPSPIKKSSQ